MSKLINKTRLEQFAEGFWDKVKRRYNNALNGATLSPRDGRDKKITFERIQGTSVEVNLQDYVRLQDRNKFEKDVSVDDAATKNNANIGAKTGTVNPSQRSLGARNLSSDLFTDGYVSKFRVYLDNSYSNQQIAIHVWAIKKGNTKADDRTAGTKVHDGTQITVNSGNNRKWIDVPINNTFVEDTYFIFRTGSSVNVEAMSNITTGNTDNVVNLVDTTPPNDANQPLTWTGEITNTTAYVEIFGRMGIKDLSAKIDQVNSKDRVVTGINGERGDVVLSVVEEGDIVKVKANDVEVGSINAITQQEIAEILATLS